MTWGESSEWESGGWQASEDGQDFWIGYADVLAGLLMVFALMLITALYYYQGEVTDVRDLLETRREITEELQKRFENTGGIDVDSASGSVRFDGQVLFNEDEAQLLPAGRRQLRAFAEEYLPVLFDTERFREHLRAIVIEGHTNDNGTYMYNLDLSQRRAFNVQAFLIDQASQYEEELREYVTANGRSFAEPIYVDGEPGVVDDVKSRRIKIRFRLNNEEVIEEIMERLFLS